MRVPTRVLPLLPPMPRCLHPVRHLRLSAALLRATALELTVLAGHLLLYPTGLTPERPGPEPASGPAGPTGPTGRRPEGTAALPVDAGQRPPVVLLHGFVDNRSVFVLLRRFLARDGGRRVSCFTYSPLTCDIRTAAASLGRHIEDICARTGHREVDVVGHSLGGLVARYYVQRLAGDSRVRTLVTLGTPHAGTPVALLAGAHPLARQMRPGSPVIEELRQPAPGCRTRCVSFWSDLDQLMMPMETACIDHPDLIAENVPVSGIGHLALPVHPAVAAGVRQALETSEPAVISASGAVSVA
ncbi:esterase/lipase family protein [Streptomyces sp. PR69]|uniref:esterase/lipase family protein n=1 Tax=Streptomyces sp. PR69 TaxID=2984950 RepID=UPI002265579D|nr:alpha/beta fold hydrolase [Streptomyces sp. PR69]